MSDKEVCGCCGKTTDRSEEERKKLIHRLNRIEGQIRGIRGMVEKDAYCTDILIQSAAVNAAVNAFNKELLASHIRGCVARDIRDGKDEVIDEYELCRLRRTGGKSGFRSERSNLLLGQPAYRFYGRGGNCRCRGDHRGGS